MIQITPKPGVELLIVEVPANSYKYTLRCTEHCNNGSLSLYDDMTERETTILIPPGSWSFIATTDTLTEEAAVGLVNASEYEYNYLKQPYIQSFRFLIQSAGGYSGKCYAILLKQTT